MHEPDGVKVWDASVPTIAYDTGNARMWGC